MLETDSPYLAPEPHRGQRNEPAFVRYVAEAVATLRGESPDELARHINEAAEHFFRFRPKSI
jgi:TatD DNase family protein